MYEDIVGVEELDKGGTEGLTEAKITLLLRSPNLKPGVSLSAECSARDRSSLRRLELGASALTVVAEG